MLCNLCYAVYAMQSRLCNLCCAIYAMQSMLCNLCNLAYQLCNLGLGGYSGLGGLLGGYSREPALAAISYAIWAWGATLGALAEVRSGVAQVANLGLVGYAGLGGLLWEATGQGELWRRTG